MAMTTGKPEDFEELITLTALGDDEFSPDPEEDDEFEDEEDEGDFEDDSDIDTDDVDSV
jgi:hypothetical protein